VPAPLTVKVPDWPEVPSPDVEDQEYVAVPVTGLEYCQDTELPLVTQASKGRLVRVLSTPFTVTIVLVLSVSMLPPEAVNVTLY
jgi:hypothetical protein